MKLQYIIILLLIIIILLIGFMARGGRGRGRFFRRWGGPYIPFRYPFRFGRRHRRHRFHRRRFR